MELITEQIIQYELYRSVFLATILLIVAASFCLYMAIEEENRFISVLLYIYFILFIAISTLTTMNFII